MKIYFDNIDAIHKFTIELNYHHNEIECPNCLRHNQFISHGFVYKKQNSGKEIAVGKRIFCSNRHGKLGCGRTIRLYLVSHIPKLQYTASHLFLFIASLLSRANIQNAYKTATGTDDPRNAYRWLHRLWKKLIDYRCFIQARTKNLTDQFKSRTERFQILLPTLQEVFFSIGDNPCTQFQKLCQISFV